MILITMAVILTLTDKTNQVKAPELSERNKNMLLKGSRIAIFLAIVTLVAGLVWGTDMFGMSMVNLGFNSILMLTFLFGFLAIILNTNARSDMQHSKAYDFKPALFDTDRNFALGAMGIVIIIVALYAYFW
jgi:SSS family solute:Na+ symporter